MSELGAAENTLVKLFRSNKEMFEAAAQRSLPLQTFSLGLEGTLELIQAGNLTNRVFRGVKKVLLKWSKYRTASLQRVVDWRRSFNCTYVAYELELECGTKQKPGKVDALVLVWDLTDVVSRDLESARKRGWVNRTFDFDGDDGREHACIKFSQDKGGKDSLWTVTVLNQHRICSARFV